MRPGCSDSSLGTDVRGIDVDWLADFRGIKECFFRAGVKGSHLQILKGCL